MCRSSIRLKPAILLCALFFVLTPQLAEALPWDRDMFRQQSYKANEMVRAPAEGTYPVGHSRSRLTTAEASEQLSNPVPFSRRSVVRGRRVWASNCTPCHGETGDGEGPVGPLMSVPSLLEGIYKSRSDGHIFGIVMNGGANMPRYGFKFSNEETWDVINYLRFLQGRDVGGVERPDK